MKLILEAIFEGNWNGKFEGRSFIIYRVKRIRSANLQFLAKNTGFFEIVGEPGLSIFTIQGIRTIYLRYIFCRKSCDREFKLYAYGKYPVEKCKGSSLKYSEYEKAEQA